MFEANSLVDLDCTTVVSVDFDLDAVQISNEESLFTAAHPSGYAPSEAHSLFLQRAQCGTHGIPRRVVALTVIERPPISTTLMTVTKGPAQELRCAAQKNSSRILARHNCICCGHRNILSSRCRRPSFLDHDFRKFLATSDKPNDGVTHCS